jgi:thiol-disulfide isomerase/thioredoxin
MAMNKNNVAAINVRSDKDVQKVDKMLQIPNAKVFILLQADWCPHCQDMKPKWKQLENLQARNVNIVSMPIEKQQKSQILKNVPVEGIPTVLEVRNGVAKAVDMEKATDVAAMAEEMSRPSNVPIDAPSTVSEESQNAVVANEELTNKNLPQVEAKQVPTNAMEELVQRIDGNSKNMGNTNGSRANNVARNLAAPASSVLGMQAPAKSNTVEESKNEVLTESNKVEESKNEVLTESNKVEEPKNEVLTESNKVEEPKNEVLTESNKVEEPKNEVLTESNKVEEPKAPVITSNKPKGTEVDMSAPQKVEDSFLQKAEEMSTFMQEEAKKNIKEAESMPAVPKQRGGGGGSKKRKGNLLKMLVKLGSPVFKRGQTRKVKKGKKAD